MATALNKNAAPTPIAIRVNILRFQLMMERQPRWKNGQPAQKTTGVVSAN